MEDAPSGRLGLSRADLRLSLGMAATALLYRALLARSYFGAEEEDWGNLGIIAGTLQSGFRYIELEHMPLYTTLSAAVTAVAGDAERGGEIVATSMGALSVFALVALGCRFFDRRVAVIAGLLLCFQPDSALGAATPLRISTYTALSICGIAAVAADRRRTAAIFLALAFFTRFDLLFSLFPLLLVGAAAESRALVRSQAKAKAWLATWLPAISITLSAGFWALVYRAHSGSFRFWGDVFARNTEAFSHRGPLDRLEPGLETLSGVFVHMLPSHLGPAVLPLALVGLVVIRRRDPAQKARTWLAAWAVVSLGFFLLSVLLSAYRWDHNLYWKWLCAAVPPLSLFAAQGGVYVWDRLWPAPSGTIRATAGVAAIGLALATVWTWTGETRGQLDRSDRWYGTQVRLMRWVEEAYPKDVGIVANLIPETFAARKPHERRFYSWRDPAIPRDDATALGRWAANERISLLIWMREEWVGASEVAPFLAVGRSTPAGPVTFEPIAREDGYGFIAYSVLGPSVPPPNPPRPPPAAGGIP